MENQKNILRIINKILKKKVKINQNEMNNVNILTNSLLVLGIGSFSCTEKSKENIKGVKCSRI